MQLEKLFSLSYLFDPRPGIFSYMAFFVGLFLLILVGSFYLERWIKKHPKRPILIHLLPNIGGRMRMFGLIGFIFLWVRYESLPYFSIRFFFLLFLLYILWVIGHSIYMVRTRFEEKIETHTVKKERNKYLPRSKKKSTKKKR